MFRPQTRADQDSFKSLAWASLFDHRQPTLSWNDILNKGAIRPRLPLLLSSPDAMRHKGGRDLSGNFLSISTRRRVGDASSESDRCVRDLCLTMGIVGD